MYKQIVSIFQRHIMWSHMFKNNIISSKKEIFKIYAFLFVPKNNIFEYFMHTIESPQFTHSFGPPDNVQNVNKPLNHFYC